LFLFQHRTAPEEGLAVHGKTPELDAAGDSADQVGLRHSNASGAFSLAAALLALKRSLSSREQGRTRLPVFVNRTDASLVGPVRPAWRRDSQPFVEGLSRNHAQVSSPVVVSIQPDRSDFAVQEQAVERPYVMVPPTELSDLREPTSFKLTIVVPVYNEEHTVSQVLESLIAQPIPGDFEIIVVDDGSTDRTTEMLQASWHHRHVHVRHETNRGKGAAVRTGISRASGTHVLVFDADSEYDPADIPKLIAPILSGRAEVVYGVRVRGAGTLFPSFINLLGNRLMTGAANLLYGSALSDLHTCLKLLPMPMLNLMPLKEEGFGLDTEISAEMLRRGFRPFEVPVSYVGRSKEEGKKIRLSDAFRCLEVLCRVRLRGRTPYGLRNKAIAPRVTVADTSEVAMLSKVADAVDM
jgi:hypothetical protein